MPFKQRAVSYPMDMIAWCDVTDIRSSRSIFRLMYNTNFGGSLNSQADPGFSGNASSFPPSMSTSTSFKHYDFECDNLTAHNIVQKVRLILELKSSATRKEYIATKEKKHYKKKSTSSGK
ncbi:hypothetical protein NQ318_004274 [Aromia moschata]|uniref:SIN1-type PH domain-containing protein n=1 Tax=Aromia moschata TaxID=1265417 RepID=A0AAV8XRA1_9CUCU|nr:hypothetical protein NQ318_004274 [Aromia moschata]